MLCRSVYAHGFTAGQKTVENQDWATGPRSRGAPGVAGRGPRAAGPSGRWAAGLLLAKPPKSGLLKTAIHCDHRIRRSIKILL